MSIVADASLGLELSADQVPDADLYAQDLGQRREALLRNWDRLHELTFRAAGQGALAARAPAGGGSRSAHGARGGADPGDRLRRAPEAGGAGRGADPANPSRASPRSAPRSCRSSARSSPRRSACAAAPSSRPPPSWPSRPRKSPGGPRARPCRRSRRPARWTSTSPPGAPSRTSSSSCGPSRTARDPGSSRCCGPARRRPPCSRRSAMSRRHSGAASSGTPTASPRDGRAICASCRVDDARRRPPPTASGRCCCWRTAWRLTWSRSRRACGRWLCPSGGYAGLEQSGARPEVTAAVLNALRRIAATEDFDAHIAQMERDLGDFEKCRPFILTTMLETSLLLKPGTKLMEMLIDSLLAARRPYGDLLLWPEKAEPLLIDPAPSVAHTARAVRVLANVQAIQARPARCGGPGAGRGLADGAARPAQRVRSHRATGRCRARTGPRSALHGRMGGESPGIGGRRRPRIRR